MSYLNRAELIGNVGADPIVRQTQSGIKVASLSVATNEQWRDNQGRQQERTEWHQIVAWNGLAGIAEQYLKKGNRVFVEGRLQTRKWDDRDGVTRYTTEVVATKLIMLDGRQPNGNGS